MNQSLSRLETMFEKYEREAQRSWKEQENSLKNMKMLLNQMLNEKEEVENQDEEVPVSSKLSMKNEVVEVFEPEAPYPQKPIEVTIDHEDSLPKDFMESHEERMEEDNQEKSHSIEVEDYMKEELTEPPMQEVFDEEITPIITQQPSFESKEVKATNKSTNPVPDPASKINQAICKRKLAEERPRQGTVAESSPPLEVIPLNKLEEEEESEEQHANSR
ncbi:hypothetical protein AHAS_Ahas03G0252100 [Arachis hypogaea]